ncbi:SDR family NAD(P)-dependent oxidoreductase [Noviherbaspirillum pedocola]|uniref:SDR family oxidoreductase n=1 Tax=Noviherbaspirillum pedocola TaxID=2801341 RepID=A0A934SR07_9BURK|nr:SDR family NAD(P)-dependent oxidoreductase [Noviherbaspirillum pedocola]MBK4735151.1 SDR family oxidoreductase [Noviherbaspirillum pedocola]
MEDLKGKAVLITGASTGIGAACARAFGQLGCRVALHCHQSLEAAAEVASEVQAAGAEAIVVRGDLRDSDECRRVVEEVALRFGGIDVLINNAGALVRRAPLAEIDDDIFDEVIDVNVRSTVMCTRHALPHLREGASVINLTSIAARTGGGPGASLYAASKGFVSTFTRGMAKELVGRRIRVNAVAPGVIVTPFHDKYSTPEQMEAMRLAIPMARLGTADECVGAFLYLASERLSGYVTGQIIEVNGGQYMP